MSCEYCRSRNKLAENCVNCVNCGAPLPQVRERPDGWNALAAAQQAALNSDPYWNQLQNALGSDALRNNIYRGSLGNYSGLPGLSSGLGNVLGQLGVRRWPWPW